MPSFFLRGQVPCYEFEITEKGGVSFFFSSPTFTPPLHPRALRLWQSLTRATTSPFFDTQSPPHLHDLLLATAFVQVFSTKDEIHNTFFHTFFHPLRANRPRTWLCRTNGHWWQGLQGSIAIRLFQARIPYPQSHFYQSHNEREIV